ncbi:unnamed protein product [Arabis nemorensis]|uniref:Mre11 DNA-binding domain-containing protein n=1 Tax=Arabis nemorensis TaxID=586526 RepID=A0A565CQV1_9BRAS|nr:unnamed protein product [Arabis nemorensis]
MEIVLKDETDIDPNDQNSILEHLDKVLKDLTEKASKKAVNISDIKLKIKGRLLWIYDDNPQRFGHISAGKDILIFSKASKKGRSEANIDDSERLHPEELNQQNIEALVDESNLKMEILPVSDLDVALHNFGKLGNDSDAQKFEDDDLILKERLKDRSTRPSGSSQFLSTGLRFLSFYVLFMYLMLKHMQADVPSYDLIKFRHPGRTDNDIKNYRNTKL